MKMPPSELGKTFTIKDFLNGTKEEKETYAQLAKFLMTTKKFTGRPFTDCLFDTNGERQSEEELKKFIQVNFKSNKNLKDDMIHLLHQYIVRCNNYLTYEWRRKHFPTIKVPEKDSKLLLDFVEILTGKRDKVTGYVLAHWMRNVIRKSYSLDIKWHTMLIFYGKQGCGKTECIKKLLTPIKEACILDFNFTKLLDSHYTYEWAGKLVCLLDEMEAAEKSDVNAIKRVITTSTITGDKKYQAPEEYENCCSFIGCCNKPLIDMIKDDTGMRRFYQIDCLDKLDWTAVNKFDFEGLWRSIQWQDYMSDEPIVKVLSEVSERQREQKYKTALEEFFDNCLCGEYKMKFLEWSLASQKAVKGYKDFILLSKFHEFFESLKPSNSCNRQTFKNKIPGNFDVFFGQDRKSVV